MDVEIVNKRQNWSDSVKLLLLAVNAIGIIISAIILECHRFAPSMCYTPITVVAFVMNNIHDKITIALILSLMALMIWVALTRDFICFQLALLAIPFVVEFYTDCKTHLILGVILVGVGIRGLLPNNFLKRSSSQISAASTTQSHTTSTTPDVGEDQIDGKEGLVKRLLALDIVKLAKVILSSFASILKGRIRHLFDETQTVEPRTEGKIVKSPRTEGKIVKSPITVGEIVKSPIDNNIHLERSSSNCVRPSADVEKKSACGRMLICKIMELLQDNNTGAEKGSAISNGRAVVGITK